MEDYNRLISSRILDSYEEMIDDLPQPTMFGGKRFRNFVLPGSTEYDYPGTLAVGRMDGQHSATLGGEFFRDFGSGFPTGSLQGSGSSGGKVSLKSIGKALKPAAPVAKELGMSLAKEGIKEGVKAALRPQTAEMAAEAAGRSGGKKLSLKSLKPLAPIAKELGMTLAKEGIKEGVKSYAKGGRRKKSILHSVGKVMGAVGKELAPVAKEVFRDVIVPEGKKALKEYIRESMKSQPADEKEPTVGQGRGRKPIMGADPRTYKPRSGGVLIRDIPSQFHSSVYPPALASYHHSFPMGHDAYGRGRAKLPKSGAKRNSARGAIVAEIMKKHGLTLAQASKYVKEHNLY
ncbi:MAG: hypothetical protein EBU90_19400 [Proteobacteria bacterium]|nr:hypothetical protein [Pseudomonadota bacterium]